MPVRNVIHIPLFREIDTETSGKSTCYVCMKATWIVSLHGPHILANGAWTPVMIHDAHFERCAHLAVSHNTYMNILTPKDSYEDLGEGP